MVELVGDVLLVRGQSTTVARGGNFGVRLLDEPLWTRYPLPKGACTMPDEHEYQPLRQGDIIRALLAERNRPTRPSESTVEIVSNSRGVNVKVQTSHPDIDIAARDVQRIYDELAARYAVVEPPVEPPAEPAAEPSS